MAQPNYSPFTNPSVMNQPTYPPPLTNPSLMNQPTYPPPLTNPSLMNQPTYPPPLTNPSLMNQPTYPPPSTNPSVMNQPTYPPPLTNLSVMNQPTYPPVTNAGFDYVMGSCPPLTNPSVIAKPNYPPVNDPSVVNQPSCPPLTNPSVIAKPNYPPVNDPSVVNQPSCPPLTNPGSNYVMGQPSYAPLSNSVAVIGPQFCAPYPVDLTIIRKVMTISDGNFAVMDVNGNIVFKIKGKLLSLRDRRVLLDATGKPLLSMQEKIMSAHRRWKVFRGDSKDPKDLIFSAKQSSLIQFRTKLDVFLASNIKEDVCDFKIKGSWLERSCVVYSGESKNIVAQMHKKHTVQSVLLGKDTFMVTVYPNIDYAFIVALILILDAINEDRGE